MRIFTRRNAFNSIGGFIIILSFRVEWIKKHKKYIYYYLVMCIKKTARYIRLMKSQIPRAWHLYGELWVMVAAISAPFAPQCVYSGCLYLCGAKGFKGLKKTPRHSRCYYIKFIHVGYSPLFGIHARVLFVFNEDMCNVLVQHSGTLVRHRCPFIADIHVWCARVHAAWWYKYLLYDDYSSACRVHGALESSVPCLTLPMLKQKSTPFKYHTLSIELICVNEKNCINRNVKNNNWWLTRCW